MFQRSKSSNKEQQTNVIENLVRDIKNCINISIDKNQFNVSLVSNSNKNNPYMVMINAIIRIKDINDDINRHLGISVDVDKKTQLIHVMVFDINKLKTSVLFATTDENPLSKLEKYLPNIISSTQSILLTKKPVQPRK